MVAAATSEQLCEMACVPAPSVGSMRAGRERVETGQLARGFAAPTQSWLRIGAPERRHACAPPSVACTQPSVACAATTAASEATCARASAAGASGAAAAGASGGSCVVLVAPGRPIEPIESYVKRGGAHESCPTRRPGCAARIACNELASAAESVVRARRFLSCVLGQERVERSRKEEEGKSDENQKRTRPPVAWNERTASENIHSKSSSNVNKTSDTTSSVMGQESSRLLWFWRGMGMRAEAFGRQRVARVVKRSRTKRSDISCRNTTPHGSVTRNQFVRSMDRSCHRQACDCGMLLQVCPKPNLGKSTGCSYACDS
eukprot:850313-Pleurochrysis_carterae.AAC.1